MVVSAFGDLELHVSVVSGGFLVQNFRLGNIVRQCLSGQGDVKDRSESAFLESRFLPNFKLVNRWTHPSLVEFRSVIQ